MSSITKMPDVKITLVLWKQKYDKEFRSMSEIAQVAATYKFLIGRIRSMQTGLGKNLAPRVFPPSTKNKVEYQLLHPGVLEKFFKEYNTEISNSELRSMDKFKTLPQYWENDEIVERICGI